MYEKKITESIEDSKSQDNARVVICGGGIVGLTLALALKKLLNITPEVYEKARAFHEDVGAGMGMYANGLRVIRDISPDLLKAIRAQGRPFLSRRFERHDGSEVAHAEEYHLAEKDEELQTIGIRRWRLQKVLYDATQDVDIPIFFGKHVSSVKFIDPRGSLVEIKFTDGTCSTADVLFGVDGSRSVVRESVIDKESTESTSRLSYMGVTCIMGTAAVSQPPSGICFPSSITSECHACFFPTGVNEQCFQFYFPIPYERAKQYASSWADLSERVGDVERLELTERLEKDGWDSKYIVPLRQANNTVRTGFCMLRPPLKKWAYGERRRVVLVGDAAHPPAIYTGQGAQMGLEDVGVIVELMKRLCLREDGVLELANFGHAAQIYETIRIPRVHHVLSAAQKMGRMQQKRAMSKKYDKVKEELLQRDIFFHEHLPELLVGAMHNYNDDLDDALRNEECHIPLLGED